WLDDARRTLLKQDRGKSMSDIAENLRLGPCGGDLNNIEARMLAGADEIERLLGELENLGKTVRQLSAENARLLLRLDQGQVREKQLSDQLMRQKDTIVLLGACLATTALFL